MKKFVLDDENLISGFFDQLDIYPVGIFAKILQQHFPEVKDDDAIQIAENFSDEIDNTIGISGIRSSIEAEADSESFVEESTGLWGHFSFEIRDAEETKARFEAEINDYITKLFKQLKKQGAFSSMT
jgi:hypothetical protein